MDRLRRIAVMARTNTVRTFRVPGNVLLMVVVPIVFSLGVGSLFSSMGEGAPDLYIVDEADTVESRAVLDALKEAGYNIHAMIRAEAVTAISSGKRQVVFVLPEDFAFHASEAVRIEVLHAPDYTDGTTEEHVRAVVQAFVEGEKPPQQLTVFETPRGSIEDYSFAGVRSVFGVYLLFAFTALFARGGALHKEREDGTFQRLVAAGIPYGDIVAAHAISIFLVGIVQAVVVLTATGLLGTLWLTGGWLSLILSVASAVFVASGLTLALSGFTRTANQMQALAGLVPTVLAMAGGALMPLAAAPLLLQQSARLNPIYWLMQVLDGGLLYQGLASQVLPMAVSLLIGTLGLVVGVQGWRRLEL